MTNLPSGEPRRYLYDLLPQYPLRPGKGLRPGPVHGRLRGVRGLRTHALPFAAALELLHNAFLVHDDIQDGSDARRGGTALHVEHGTPLALNAGDALAARANAAFLRAVRAVAPARREDPARRLGADDQPDDRGPGARSRLDARQRRRPDDRRLPGDVRRQDGVVHDDPAARHRRGRRIGRRRRASGTTFRFGWLLGLLFQIANDLDGIHAEGHRGEIEEGKRTILVIHLLATLTGEDRDEAVRIMGLPPNARGDREVAWMLERMEEAGSVEHARSCVWELAVAARQEGERVFRGLPASDARDLLLSITTYVLDRHGLL